MEQRGWALQQELLSLLRKWYVFVALFLAGSAAGWLIGGAVPAVYEASAGLKVSFNSDALYLTPDDYKNWQMEELEDLVLSDGVLAETLTLLEARDPGWSSSNVEDLRGGVAPRWRNAGVWNLSATLSDPDAAEQLAGAWREASLAAAEKALGHALAFDRLDRQLDGLARELSEIRADQALLAQVLQGLNQLQAPSEGPLTGQRAEEIYEQIQRIQVLGTGENDFPGRGAAAAELAAWAGSETGRASAVLNDLSDLESRLLEEYDRIGAEWLFEKEASAGLSAYLTLGMPADASIRTEMHRPSGLLALVGGVIAVLVWLAFRLVRTGMQETHPDERPD